MDLNSKELKKLMNRIKGVLKIKGVIKRAANGMWQEKLDKEVQEKHLYNIQRAVGQW